MCESFSLLFTFHLVSVVKSINMFVMEDINMKDENRYNIITIDNRSNKSIHILSLSLSHVYMIVVFRIVHQFK